MLLERCRIQLFGLDGPLKQLDEELNTQYQTMSALFLLLVPSFWSFIVVQIICLLLCPSFTYWIGFIFYERDSSNKLSNYSSNIFWCFSLLLFGCAGTIIFRASAKIDVCSLLEALLFEPACFVVCSMVNMVHYLQWAKQLCVARNLDGTVRYLLCALLVSACQRSFISVGPNC